MLPLPNPEPVLNANHLEALEDIGVELEAAMGRGETPTMPEGVVPVSRVDAMDSVTRIRYHKGHIARIDADANSMLAPLLAQIDQIRAWQKEQTEYRQARIRFHEGRLAFFYQLNKPADGKHMDLPGARIQAKQSAPKWDYGNEKALVELLKSNNCAPLLRVKHEIDKDELKENAFCEDGKWFVPNADGEAIELPITVTTPPVEYTVKLTEPKGA